jgi:hypothetical protein
MPYATTTRRSKIEYKYTPNYPTYRYGKHYKPGTPRGYKGYRPVATKPYMPKPLRSYTPVPLKDYTPKPLKDYTPVPLKDYKPKPLKDYTPVPLKPYTPKPIKDYKPVPLKQYTPVPLKPYTPKPGGAVRGKHKGVPLGGGRSKEICPYCGGGIILPTTGRVMLCKHCRNKVHYVAD